MAFRVSKTQREILVQFLERFSPLALGALRTKEDFVKLRLMWDKLARQLNKIYPRVVKSGKGWNRYWVDVKFKFRKKYLRIQNCKKLGKPCPELSDFDKRLMHILVDDEGNLIAASGIVGGCYEKSFDPGEKTEEESDVKDVSMNSNDENTVESDDHCVTIEYDEDGGEVATEYITMDDHHTPDNNLQQKVNSEHSNRAEDIKRKLLEVQLQREKELFLMEKEHRLQRHKLEMDILYLRKETMKKQLQKIWK